MEACWKSLLVVGREPTAIPRGVMPMRVVSYSLDPRKFAQPASALEFESPCCSILVPSLLKFCFSIQQHHISRYYRYRLIPLSCFDC